MKVILLANQQELARYRSLSGLGFSAALSTAKHGDTPPDQRDGSLSCARQEFHQPTVQDHDVATLPDFDLAPFLMDVPESALAGLRDRLARTRWLPDFPDPDWTYGVAARASNRTQWRTLWPTPVGLLAW